ncbi:MAG: hypothetical protein A2V98_26145 [Planctomycetes bacterium RBG_16_64_12]|nr:MAG: hypothetical protein A2V98_26145 [Planctomycetes bacterium RBG_16_64_12]
MGGKRAGWRRFFLPSVWLAVGKAERVLPSGWRCLPVLTASREFGEMVRERKVQALDDWIARVSASEGAVELRRFAEGLRGDLAAGKAALSLPWSNGQTEGQVNRLKLIKRQMFGRAKFDLLRQRVLCAC